MIPNLAALTRALQAEKTRTKDDCSGDAPEWCRMEYGRAVRHG